MDDFSVYGTTFDYCLARFDKVLQRCEDTNLVLNWEKCHFAEAEGIVLGHKISGKGIQADIAKINAIEKLPYPVNVKGIRSFLAHAEFYIRFINNFSKVAKPLTNILQNDTNFIFDEKYITAFKYIKNPLVNAPTVKLPNWDKPFAYDYSVEAILGQYSGDKFNVIHYASRTLKEAQQNYPKLR